MLELLTKEYIVASMHFGLVTDPLFSLQSPLRTCDKKTKQRLVYSTTDIKIHASMFPEAWKARKHAFLSLIFGGPAIWFLLCWSHALKSTQRFEAILSLLFGLGMDVLLTRGILSLKEPEGNSFASLKSFKPWSMLVFFSIHLINIVPHFDSKWQKMAVWLRMIPIPLLGRLIFVRWVPCRIWRKHNTTSIHKIKQIIIWERKIEYQNSESNPILDDRHHRM